MSKEQSNFKGLRDEVKQLQEEGAKLEAQYHASHAALYRLLERAFDILTRATNEDQVEELVALSERWAKEHKHKFKQTSDVELRLVTIVFAGAAKQRVNNYANVLRAAQGRDQHKSFADWIGSKGGVQEISYSVAQPINAEKKKEADAKLITAVAELKGTLLQHTIKDDAWRGFPFVMLGFVRADDGAVVALSTNFHLDVVRPFALKAVKKAADRKKVEKKKAAEPAAKNSPQTTYDEFFVEVQDGSRKPAQAPAEKKVA
jgi:hypothetical protein